MPELLPQLQVALSDRYRLERELGRGGMATVYLAQDLRHDRRVAVKVLRPELAAVIGADRFLAEIRTTANLQHPQILPLFDSGEVRMEHADRGEGARTTLFYVMPYIEGESLRQRLDREKQLPVPDAVRIATEVAGALDYAHRHGVIHRDIKPENILLHEDRALVADFGIALAASKAGGTRMTETGISLGTPQYMSPEQAMGDREITARSDVYALGCVLYEMLTGEPPFSATTAQAILAKVVSAEPARVTACRKTVPPNVEAAVQCALAKVPADRFRSAADFGAALSNPAFLAPSGTLPSATRTRTWWNPLSAALTVASVLLLAATVRDWTRRSAEVPETGVARFSINLPDSLPVAFIGAAALGNGRRAIALSPDGRTLVYVGLNQAVARLYTRPIGSYEVRQLPGTEGAYGPFFSPNGRWIGFFVGNELKKIRVDGGEPVRLAEATNSQGADWGMDNRIVFAIQEGTRLLRISDEGGLTEDLSGGRSIALDYGWPQALPGGEAILLSGGRQPRILNLRTRQESPVAIMGTDARYAAGYLVFVQGSVLFAARFDLEQRKVVGPAVPVLSGIRSEIYGQGQWDLSVDGTLVYAAGQSVAENPMVWIRRDGSREGLSLPTRVRGTFEVSPDGQRLAVVERSGASSDLWVYDLPGLRAQRLTVRGSIGSAIFWSSDSKRLAYHTVELGFTQPYIQAVDGGASAERLLQPDDSLQLQSWSADARLLGANPNGRSSTQSAVYVVDRTTGRRYAITTVGGAPWGTAVSPDGRAIAYTSDETGEYHIYIQSFPPTAVRRQISRTGGSEEPRWSRDGTRLFFRSGQRLMAVTVATRPELKVGEPRVFFEGDFVNVAGRSYDVAPDGQRVLVIEGGTSEARSLRVVQGWFTELGRLVP